MESYNIIISPPTATCIYMYYSSYFTDIREEVAAEYEREEKLVFLEERAADVAVEVVGEVLCQVAKPAL